MAVSQTSGAFRSRLLAAAIGQALALGAGEAVAVTIPVGGACTLADAVTAANTDAAVNGCPAGSGHDVITLAGASSHTLAATLTVESGAVTIQGNGAVIEPSGPFRLLTVEATGDLTLEAVTLQGGDNLAGGAVGVNGGALTVRNSTLRNNTAYAGGAIFSAGGTVALVDSTVSGNYAKYTGGGIYNSGEMTVSGSTVSGNSAGFAGGGIATLEGSLTITNSTISGNIAIDCEAPGPDCEAAGGGIFAYSGTLSVTGGSISRNYASKYGGGVAAAAAGVTIDGTTVSENGSLLVGGGLAFTEGPSGPGPGPGPAPDFQASSTRAPASGDVVLRNCTISGNLSFIGAGIIDSVGSATSRCSITGNSAYVAAGGMLVGSYYEHTTITDSVISGNVAGVYGGGGVGVKYDSSLEVSNSTIADNTAGGYGGGVANSGLLSITNSTVSGNTAGASGGIYNYGAMELTSATVAFNRATGDLSPPDRSVFSDLTPEQQKQLDRLRPSGERARGARAQAAPPYYAGGIGAYGDPGYSGSELLANTIVAGNIGHDCVGNPEAMLAVLVQDGTCGPTLSGDPLLAPLGDYGGPTPTHALYEGSPAINAGDNSACAGLSYDQRGAPFDRQLGSACDLGAYESIFSFESIPTLGGFAMGLLSLLMGALGLGSLRRRR